MAGRRLAVDWPSCSGQGVCAEILPEIVQLDEWGYPLIAAGPVPASLRRYAQLAVKSCPTLALRLVEVRDRADPAGPAPARPFPEPPVPGEEELVAQARPEPQPGTRRAARLSAGDRPRRRARRSS
jgi:ferredoxin